MIKRKRWGYVLRISVLPLIKKVQRLHETVVITRNGKAAAVLMSLDEYEGILETIEILSDPKLMKILRKSKKESNQQNGFLTVRFGEIETKTHRLYNNSLPLSKTPPFLSQDTTA